VTQAIILIIFCIVCYVIYNRQTTQHGKIIHEARTSWHSITVCGKLRYLQWQTMNVLGVFTKKKQFRRFFNVFNIYYCLFNVFYVYAIVDAYRTVVKLIRTATPDTTKLSCPCRVRFGGVNWIPDNSRLSPTKNPPKSEHVNSNCAIHTATPDTTQDRTVLSCLAGGVNWA